MPKIHLSNLRLSAFLSVLLGTLLFSSLAFSQDEQEMSDETMDEVADEVMEESAEPESILNTRYLCELQGLTRRVEVDFESTQSSIPCSVNYYKDTEAPGEVNTLWNATNIEGYCEDKAAGFVAKLKSWGWSCTEG